MKATLFALAVAGIASALPARLVERQAAINDNDILQYALTLEHLENTFYKQAIQKFGLQGFLDAGYDANYFNNLNYIAHDEEQHVMVLEAALKTNNQQPVQACTYTFPYTDVPSFITLSSVLEGVGSGAYLGAAGLITNKDYLTVAGSILGTESIHTAIQRLAINEVPMANPYVTPLDGNSVFTLASMFIVECPASNAPLPFTPFLALQVDESTCTCEEPECGTPSDVVKRSYNGLGWPGKRSAGESNCCAPPTTGSSVMFTAAGTIPAGSYVTFVNGLSTTSVEGTISGMTITASVPSMDGGQTYVFVTSSDVETDFEDAAVLFGPAVLEVNPMPPTFDDSYLKE